MNISNSGSERYEYLSKIELTAVAGTDEVALTALRAGADAVYLGVSVNAGQIRVCGQSFDKAAVLCRYIKQEGRRWYVYLDILVNEKMLQDIFRLLEWAQSHGVSGIYICDPGVMRVVRSYFPKLSLHAGQMFAIHSSDGARQMHKIGAQRVVLSHELSLEEIEQIAATVPQMDYQVYVHGETCFSSPGMCMCSSFTKHRSDRLGMCAKPCRSKWQARSQETFCFSLKDICAIAYLDRLIKNGVTSFAIRGYADNPYFMEQVVLAYRTVIDAYRSPMYDAVCRQMMRYLGGINTRISSDGFLRLHPADMLDPQTSAGTGRYIGTVVAATQRKMTLEVNEGQQLQNGDRVIIYERDYERLSTVTLDDIRPVSTTRYQVLLHRYYQPGSLVYLDRQSVWNNDVITNELNGIYTYYSVGEGHDKLTGTRHNRRKTFMADMRQHQADYEPDVERECMLVRFENPQWVSVLDDKRVDYGIFTLNCEMLDQLEALVGQWQGYDKHRIIFELPALMFDTQQPAYERAIDRLIDYGYRHFAINNIGQLQLFENRDVQIMAGSSIICVNRQAVFLLRELGISVMTYCLESDFVNLRALLSHHISCAVCLPVFFVPVLMRSRVDVSASIESDATLIGPDEEQIIVMRENNTTIVVPAVPVSITHLINRFKKSDLAGVIIDLSYIPPSLEEWNHLYAAYEHGEPVQGAVQFNFFTKLK